MDVPGASHPPQVCSRCGGGGGGALRSTLLQWCPEPHHYSPKPPSFPLSQPSCSSTWVQNHEFSKSLKTTQRGNQGARGFQRRAALPCISKSCPIADLTYTHTHTHTHARAHTPTRARTAFSKKPAQPFSPHPAPPPPGWGRQHSQGFPSPIPRPPLLPKPAHAPFPSSLLPSHP